MGKINQDMIPEMDEIECTNMTDCEINYVHPIDKMPIGMAYVPWQKWRDVYDGDIALQRGTIFSELDKPYLGEAVM